MLLLTLLFHSLLTPAFSDEGKTLEISVQCSFSIYQNPNCPQIAEDFFKQYNSHFTASTIDNKSAVHVVIRDFTMPNGNPLYQFHFFADAELYDMEDIKLAIELPYNLDNTLVLNRIVDALLKGAMAFLDVKPEVKNEEIVVKLEPPVVGPGPDGKKENTLYGELNGSFSMSETLVNSNYNGGLGYYASHTGTRLKIQMSGNEGYQKISVSNSKGATEAENFSDYQKFIGSYSIGKKKRWSAALIAINQRNPGANITENFQAGAGVEWNVIPYRTTQNHEFMFRMGATRNDMELNLPNKIGFTSDQYSAAFVSFSTYWLLMNQKLSLTASTFYSQNLKYTDYNQIQLNGQAYYTVSKSVRLSWTVGYSYQKNSITYPAVQDYSNPIRSIFLSGAPGRTFSQSFGVVINIGNNSSRLRDRRWAGF